MPAVPDRSHAPASSPRPILAACVLLLGAALALINSTIANVAIPSIQQSLNLTAAGVAWSLAGWALAYALVLIPAGRLGDRFGHKWMFVIGIAGFTITSVTCAIAVTEGQLVLFRLLQGLTGGLFFPAIAAMLSELFTGRDRGRAFAAMGATFAAAAAVGPLLGGLVLQVVPGDESWRAVFLLNAPLGIVVLVGAIILLPGAGRRAEAGLDLIGFGILTAALTGILLALILGEDIGWPLWVWGALAGGVALVAIFAMWERRLERRGKATLVAPALFRNRDFALSAAISFAQFAGFISVFYLLSLLWQSGLQRTPLEVGLLTLPEALASIVGAGAVTRITARWGSRTGIVWGSGLMAAGIGLVALVLAAVPSEQLTVVWLIVPLVVTGLGSGVGLSIILGHALSSLEPRYSGVGSGIIAAMQRTGNAVGLAIAGSVFFTLLATSDAETIGDPAQYAQAGATAMCVCAAITALSFVLALFLPRHRVGGTSAAPTAVPSEASA